MSDKVEYVLKEYEISKDSIKSVMTQLIAVSASLLTVSVVVVKLMFDDEKTSPEPLLGYMIILLINFLAAFTAYQNIQVIALQMHIKSLEAKLKHPEIFRWESRIARVWYGSTRIAFTFNVLLVVPPFFILALLYYELSQVIGSNFLLLGIITFNILYLMTLSSCCVVIIKRLKLLIE